MKIIQLEAENIKRLTAVNITPEGNVVEITGKNGQGKTSVLDAIWFALGGGNIIQKKPIREGAENGKVRLDIGEYIVERKFKLKEGGDFTTSITVSTREGARFQKPQDILKGLMGELSFDPLHFSRMKPKEQVEQLRALVPDFDFTEMEKQNKADFEARTEVNRDIRRLEAEISITTPPEGTPDEAEDLDTLYQEREAAIKTNADIDADANDRRLQIERVDIIKEQIRENQDIIDRCQEALDGALKEKERRAALLEQEEAKLEKMAGAGRDKVDVGPIQERIDEVKKLQSAINAKQQCKRLQEELAGKTRESDRLTKAMEERREKARAAVAAANLPVPGMEIQEDGLFVAGVPFEQLSDAQQLQISIAVAAALNPKLRVIRVRDGSLLDSDSMAALRKHADENDVQVWIERVTDGEGGGVVIEDGHVRAMSEAAE